MSETSVEELLERIQRYLHARQNASTEATISVLRGERFSDDVYQGLVEAEAIMSSVYVKPFLTSVTLPLLGPLWQRIRAAFHDLVVFYVNRLAGAQVTFNRALTAGLIALVRDLDKGGRADPSQELANLRGEMEALRGKVAALENELVTLRVQIAIDQAPDET